MTRGGGASLASVLAALEAIAPLALAESWDNVGLLVPPADAGRAIERVFFTIDLTEPVFDEARAAGADLVVAYHPVVFEGKKRFSLERASDRVLLGAIRAGLPIFCPHTSLDVAPGCLTDWLASGIGEGAVRAIEARVPPKPIAEGAVAGLGRVLELAAPRHLDAIVASLKAHLGVDALRVAGAGAALVRTAAVCAGAGGAVLERAGAVDLIVTGEMRHHDVLARVAAGTHVILAEHTNSERGFLSVYRERVAALVPGVSTILSTRDRDPLAVA